MIIRTSFIYISFITLSTYCMENANEQELSTGDLPTLEQQHTPISRCLHHYRSLQEELNAFDDNYESPADNMQCIILGYLSCGLTLCPLIFCNHQ